MDKNTIVAKLQATQNLTHKWLASGGNYLYRDEFMHVFNRFSEIANELRTQHPNLFKDLPDRQIPDRDGTGDSKPLLYLSRVRTLTEDIEYCLDLLTTITTLDVPSMNVTREGVFFAGQYFDALFRVREIFAQAKTNIVIIDGYINEDVLNLLSAKATNIEVSILTKPISAALNTSAKAFNKQYGKLSIRSSTAFHDRFVFVDDTDFYHFGASIKDAGHRGFMFSRIEEPLIIKSLQSNWIQEWSAAKLEV